MIGPMKGVPIAARDLFGHSVTPKKNTAMDQQEFAVIRTFQNSSEAVIYQALLQSNGIQCELINEITSNMLPIGIDIFPVRLVVNRNDLKQAEEILAAQFDKQEFDTESAKRRKKP